MLFYAPMETKALRFTACLGAALLAAALHLRTVAFGFVYDDDHLIVNNGFLREAWSPIRAFTTRPE